MVKNNTVSQFNTPIKIRAAVSDTLTEIARQGAQQMLSVALAHEVAAFLEQYQDIQTDDGLQRFVRNGHLPARTVQTGIGDIPIQQPRVRDREHAKEDEIQFSSAILPRYLRRSKSLDALLPVLYLRGISTGDFQAALDPILGHDAKNISHSVISSLKSAWEEEYHTWNKRSVSEDTYVYWWADGIYLQARMCPSDKAA